jgi:uncharacterized membrane protein YhaH (DUF805 family)
MLMPLQRYADFSGRARRREYWMFVLLILVAVFIAGLAATATGGSFRTQAQMSSRFSVWAGFALLPLIVPLIAVTVRRLHDLGLSSWWLLVLVIGSAIPAIDTLVGLAHMIVMALPGKSKPNRFGDDPKATPVAR